MRKVFCIESGASWGGPCHAGAALPVLASLRCSGYGLEHIVVADAEELFAALERWAEVADQYKVLYLPFHGSPGFISLPDQNVSIERIGQFIDGRGRGGHAHFSSCGTLNTPPKSLSTFLKQSGLRRVSGFEKSIRVQEAAAFEILLLDYLLTGVSDKCTSLVSRNIALAIPTLSTNLGFRIFCEC